MKEKTELELLVDDAHIAVLASLFEGGGKKSKETLYLYMTLAARLGHKEVAVALSTGNKS